MTRHLNVWASTENALFDRTAWDAWADPELTIDELHGQPCFAVLDMAARTDRATAVTGLSRWQAKVEPPEEIVTSGNHP